MGYPAIIRKAVRRRVESSVAELRHIYPDWSAASESSLTEFSQALVDALRRSLRYRDVALLLRTGNDQVYSVQAWNGYEGVSLAGVEFGHDSPLIRQFSAHPVPTQHAQLERLPWLYFLGKRERDALDRLHGRLYLPLSSEGELLGVLVLGQKVSRKLQRRGSDLSESDRAELAAMVQQAQQRHQMHVAHRPHEVSSTSVHQLDSLMHLERAAQDTAHDLNNIFTSILCQAQLLEEQQSSREVTHRTAAISQAAFDGAEALRRLRDIGNQTLSPQPGSVDINDIIRTSLEMMEPRWRQGRLSWSSAIGRRLFGQTVAISEAGNGTKGPLPDLVVTLRPAGSVVGSPADLRRVLTNIIFNAVDALPPEGGRLEITSGRDGGWAVITVRDNGSGMSPEVMAQAFRTEFTTKGPIGSGLGLAISQGIVARHGGILDVESRAGTGSTFTIRLPLAEPETVSKV